MVASLPGSTLSCALFVLAVGLGAALEGSLALAVWLLSFWHYYLYWLAFAFGAAPFEVFKRDAVAQVEDRGYPVREVAERLGVSTKSIYTWQKQFSRPAKVIQEVDAQADEIRRVNFHANVSRFFHREVSHL